MEQSFGVGPALTPKPRGTLNGRPAFMDERAIWTRAATMMLYMLWRLGGSSGAGWPACENPENQTPLRNLNGN